MSYRKIEFSPSAIGDLQDIVQYTTDQWGEAQASRYLGIIDNAINRVGDFPNIGRLRDDWKPGTRVVAAGHHLIYYSEEEKTILIVRVVHRRTESLSET